MTRGLRLDSMMLEAALHGLQQKRNEIDARIGELRAWLGKNAGVGAALALTSRGRKKGPMSAATPAANCGGAVQTLGRAPEIKREWVKAAVFRREVA